MLHKLLSFLLLVAFSWSAHAADVWKVTSLDWQPFSGSSLPEGGAAIAVLRAALKAEGVTLEVQYVPWTRALRLAKDPAYVGYFPAWREDIQDGFMASAALFKSPVGFAEPKESPLQWSRLEDLKGKTIGTVQDYGNTAEFMQLVNSGVIKTEVVMDDLINLRKVAGRRVDGAFIDLNNLQYLLRNEGKVYAGKAQANAKTLDNKELYLAINRAYPNKRAAEIVASGLAKIKPDQIIKEYMEKHLK